MNLKKSITATFGMFLLLNLSQAQQVQVQVLTDTNPDNPCERAVPSSPQWYLQNYLNRTVIVTLARSYENNGKVIQDKPQYTLSAKERKQIGCQMWTGGHQSYSVISIK